MLYVGIDDTDIVGSPGTNQLARAILAHLGDAAEGAVICRHQLLVDERVPYTSKNGSASIQLPAIGPDRREDLTLEIGKVMRRWFIAGSDPGLCVAAAADRSVESFGQACKREVVSQQRAREVAAAAGVHLEGLGGSEQGVIGALAAVGLITTGHDGRVVHLASWPYPDSLSGPQDVSAIRARGIEEIRTLDGVVKVMDGAVDVGKHLRPNIRDGRIVLLVEPTGSTSAPSWRALKLP